jgi:hypothetical protein
MWLYKNYDFELFSLIFLFFWCSNYFLSPDPNELLMAR